MICHGAGFRNVCGDCGYLDGAPGAPCDAEAPDSIWTCTPEGGVGCRNPAPGNACGGTGVLEIDGEEVSPGQPCDAECGAGRVACDRIEGAGWCEGPGTNACGGCDTLNAEPRAPCGCDSRGVFVCDESGDDVACDGPATNTCGGCSPLADPPGVRCGVAGMRLCESRDATICVESVEERNACGGTETLVALPGLACGACDTGSYVCDTVDSVVCDGDRGAAAFDACGGCEPVGGAPGFPCGVCGLGVVACGEAGEIYCDGDPGVSGRNACGGCVELPGAPDERCGSCASWRCADGGIECLFDGGRVCLPPPLAPTDVSATTTLPGAVEVTWSAVVGATLYEIEVGGSGVWTDMGAETVYTDTGAPPPTITPCEGDGLTASQGTSVDHVLLSCTGAVVHDGPEVTYRVRASNPSGPGAASGLTSGRRAGGTVGYAWEWAESEFGAFAALPDATASTHEDADAPADGTVRWYRVQLTADGADPVTSAAVSGFRSDVPYEGWVAYGVTRTGRAHVVSSDRALGPYQLPGEELPFGLASGPDFSPDGTRVVYGYNDLSGAVLRIFTLADGTHEDLLGAAPFFAITFPDWSPDGTRVAFRAKLPPTVYVFNIFVLDLDSGVAAPITYLTDRDAESRFVSAPSWSADGTRLFYITGSPSTSEGLSDVWMMNDDGSGAERVTSGANPLGGVAVRADGNEIMYFSTVEGRHRQVRRGINPDPPEGALAFGVEVDVHEPTSDDVAACEYFGATDRAVCERRVDGVKDVVVIDLETGETLINLSESPLAVESHPSVSPLPYTDRPLTPPPD